MQGIVYLMVPVFKAATIHTLKRKKRKKRNQIATAQSARLMDAWTLRRVP